MADQCDQNFCVCNSHRQYQRNANRRNANAKFGFINKENNEYKSETFVKCSFGPTKEGYIVQDLMSLIDNDLLCDDQSTQFCSCDIDNKFQISAGQLIHTRTGQYWDGQKLIKPEAPEEEEVEVVEEDGMKIDLLSQEMLIFAGAILLVLVIILCWIIIACCRKNTKEIRTVTIQKEFDNE